VLVEPRIPQNTGNIARLCACTGADLFLIGDLGFQLEDKFLRRSALDYGERVTPIHLPDWEALLAARPGWTPIFVETGAKNTHLAFQYPSPCLLVFGSETMGLPAWVLEDHPEQCVRIPMRAGNRSLNLSNAVSIVLYEAIRQGGFEALV
jgi:tRNA (cytidine/uridine-2'-O-)-methyltransferase